MIASARGLAILAAVAGALLVILLVAGPRDDGPVDRSLLPGFDADKVTSISFQHGQLSSRIDRAGDTWRIAQPPGIANPATVDAVFTALRGGRWHRRGPASQADVPAESRASTGITVGSTSFSIGKELPGTGQTWIVRRDRHGSDALLVDSWVANALTPSPLELRVLHPFECGPATTITATTPDGSLRIEHGRLVEPTQLWLDERLLRALADACANLEIRSLDGHPDAQQALRIAADARTLVQSGSCDDPRLVHVETPSGGGCVDASAIEDLRAAIHSILTATHDAIDLRPLPVEPATLTLQDGSVLDLAKQPRIGDADADPDQVRELVGALSARGERALPRPSRAPTATIRVVDRAGAEITLELFARERAIGRAGEPGVIRVGDAAWTTITRPSSALRDPTRWREDVTTLSSLTLDHVTYKRGAVLGEWTREPAGTFDPTLVDALAETLATMRAPAGPPPRRIAHRLTVTFTPPVGAPTKHTIEFAAPTSEGCAARVDGVAVVLPLASCTAAVALAAQR